jgi:hypothetical protein
MARLCWWEVAVGGDEKDVHNEMASFDLHLTDDVAE